jgi:hypothetical protein
MAMLYDNLVLESLQALAGGEHCFAKQLATQEGQSLRDLLGLVCQAAPESAAKRWREALHSLDNRIFFQGFSEAVSFHHLRLQGWEGLDISGPGSALQMKSPEGRMIHLVCLSIVQERDAELERVRTEKLRLCLERITAPYKIGLIIRRPLNNDFDSEQIRRAVDLWLRKSTGETGTFAYYKNKDLWLEFGIIGKRTELESQVVKFIQGPVLSHDALQAIEHEATTALDNNRIQEPIVLSIVSNQPLPIKENAMRFFLYGPTHTAPPASSTGAREYLCDADQLRGWFNDPFRNQVCSVLRIEQVDNGDPTRMKYMAFQNPWFFQPAISMPKPRLEAIEMKGHNPLLCLKE